MSNKMSLSPKVRLGTQIIGGLIGGAFGYQLTPKKEPMPIRACNLVTSSLVGVGVSVVWPEITFAILTSGVLVIVGSGVTIAVDSALGYFCGKTKVDRSAPSEGSE